MKIVETLAKAYQTVSLVGMVKNAGKTTLLNELIEQAEETKVRLGLTTIGHDGEDTDLVTQTPKPRIEVEAGTLVATAKGMLEKGGGLYEVLEVTDYPTAFGPVVLVRMLRRGRIELMGPRSSTGVKGIADRMISLGADLVLIDGALDRVSSASPAVSDAAILSTGAALSRDLGQVVSQTAHRIDMMQLKEVSRHRPALEMLRGANKVGVIDQKGGFRVFDLKTGLRAGKVIAESLTKESETIFFPGALTGMTLKGLIEHCSGNLEIVAVDGSKLFIDREEYLEIRSRGLSLKVLDPINLVGVSVNPVSPKGYRFDSAEFLRAMQAKAGDLPVMDVYQL